MVPRLDHQQFVLSDIIIDRFHMENRGKPMMFPDEKGFFEMGNPKEDFHM
jgi:hypothetical protein